MPLVTLESVKSEYREWQSCMDNTYAIVSLGVCNNALILVASSSKLHIIPNQVLAEGRKLEIIVSNYLGSIWDTKWLCTLMWSWPKLKMIVPFYLGSIWATKWLCLFIWAWSKLKNDCVLLLGLNLAYKVIVSFYLGSI